MRRSCRTEINGPDCFGGSSESIILLSCCVSGGQREERQQKNVRGAELLVSEGVNGGTVKGVLCTSV